MADSMKRDSYMGKSIKEELESPNAFLSYIFVWTVRHLFFACVRDTWTFFVSIRHPFMGKDGMRIYLIFRRPG